MEPPAAKLTHGQFDAVDSGIHASSNVGAFCTGIFSHGWFLTRKPKVQMVPVRRLFVVCRVIYPSFPYRGDRLSARSAKTKGKTTKQRDFFLRVSLWSLWGYLRQTCPSSTAIEYIYTVALETKVSCRQNTRTRSVHARSPPRSTHSLSLSRPRRSKHCKTTSTAFFITS